MLKLEIRLSGAFYGLMYMLEDRMVRESKRAMQSGMEEVAEKTKRLHASLSSYNHDQTVGSWLMPGYYEASGFEWETTGLSVESIQGYAIGEGKPEDLPSVVDAFGRVHETAASRVAPIPQKYQGLDMVVGVLTMTTAYAPVNSQSSATYDAGTGREGLQAFELFGSYDGHIAPHTPLTILGLETYKSTLEAHLRDKLRRVIW